MFPSFSRTGVGQTEKRFKRGTQGEQIVLPGGPVRHTWRFISFDVRTSEILWSYPWWMVCHLENVSVAEPPARLCPSIKISVVVQTPFQKDCSRHFSIPARYWSPFRWLLIGSFNKFWKSPLLNKDVNALGIPIKHCSGKVTLSHMWCWILHR